MKYILILLMVLSFATTVEAHTKRCPRGQHLVHNHCVANPTPPSPPSPPSPPAPPTPPTPPTPPVPPVPPPVDVCPLVTGVQVSGECANLTCDYQGYGWDEVGQKCVVLPVPPPPTPPVETSHSMSGGLPRYCSATRLTFCKWPDGSYGNGTLHGVYGAVSIEVLKAQIINLMQKLIIELQKEIAQIS